MIGGSKMRGATSARYFFLSAILSGVVSGQDVVGSDEDKYEYPKLGQAPFVVALTSKAGVCTGTILNKEWVLTAAHCMFRENAPEKMIGQRDMKVQAGVIDHDMPQQFAKQETQSLEIMVHPKFWYNRVAKYDVALVKVRDEFEFNEWVASIKVSGEPWPQPTQQRNKDLDVTMVVNDTLNCMWLGFGAFKTTSPASSKLKQMNVTAAHGEEVCSSCPLPFQRKRLICFKEQTHSMTCQGDDGGPLICNNFVRGIVHMVWNRNTCDDLSYPKFKCQGGNDRALTMFTFLCPYNDWLHSIVEEVPPRPESCRAPPAAAIGPLPPLLAAAFALFSATSG